MYFTIWVSVPSLPREFTDLYSVAKTCIKWSITCRLLCGCFTDNAATSIIRSHSSGPKVAALYRFHCNWHFIVSQLID